MNERYIRYVIFPFVPEIRRGSKSKGRVFIFRLCTIFFFFNCKDMKEVAASTSSS